MLPRWAFATFLGSSLLLGCGGGRSARYPTSEDGLALSRVVLYRNGIGYFERRGEVDGDMLRLKVRKDQVNDLLKSLTVIDRRSGRALSVSMPLDPTTWASAALATLGPGRGRLAEVLDLLRGTEVVLETDDGSVSGRIMMVERIEQNGGPVPLPAQAAARHGHGEPGTSTEVDYRVTLMDGERMQVVRLATVTSLTLRDADLAMQFHRSLDAASGEGMFQQVEVSVRLGGPTPHDVAVSYVVAAPIWKPTYRVVLPEHGKGKALLQAWAVVDNVSGEDWRDVELALTSGAPISFQYDLRTPEHIERVDRSSVGTQKRVEVAVGEASYEPEPEPPPAPPPEALAPAMAEAAAAASAAAEAPGGGGKTYQRAFGSGAGSSPASAQKAKKVSAEGEAYGYAGPSDRSAALPRQATRPAGSPAAAPPAAWSGVDAESLARSLAARAQASTASGLTRFDLKDRVTVPEGSATMVALINAQVEGEETFLFRPGGSGAGYEANPYRVVRFRNTTPFVLEPGPISIYAAGSFVGEGISEAISAQTSATIPFAVEPDIMVSSRAESVGGEMQLLRIVRGVMEVETFQRRTTEWRVKARTKQDGFTVQIRHPKAGGLYALIAPPKGTEELPDAYLVPLLVAKGHREATLKLVEETPSRTQITLWDEGAVPLLQKLLQATNLSPADRQKLEPIVQRRLEMGKLESKIRDLEAQRRTFDQRAEEERQHLEAIRRNPEAAALRARISGRVEEFTAKGNALAIEVAKAQQRKMELRIELEDLLQNFELRVREPTRK